MTSFDGTATHAAPIELQGERGTLSVPDPNAFDGDCRVRLTGDAEWTRVAPAGGFTGASRGVGLLDFARSRARSQPRPRASGQLAFHVLDIMSSMLESAEEGRRIALRSTAETPEFVPLGGDGAESDEGVPFQGR